MPPNHDLSIQNVNLQSLRHNFWVILHLFEGNNKPHAPVQSIEWPEGRWGHNSLKSQNVQAYVQTTSEILTIISSVIHVSSNLIQWSYSHSKEYQMGTTRTQILKDT